MSSEQDITDYFLSIDHTVSSIETVQNDATQLERIHRHLGDHLQLIFEIVSILASFSIQNQAFIILNQLLRALICLYEQLEDRILWLERNEGFLSFAPSTNQRGLIPGRFFSENPGRPR